MQCDPEQGSCWCVLGSGEEVPGTRVAGSQPACESKLCRPACGGPLGWCGGLLTSSSTQVGWGDSKDTWTVWRGRQGSAGGCGCNDPHEIWTGVYFLKTPGPGAEAWDLLGG